MSEQMEIHKEMHEYSKRKRNHNKLCTMAILRSRGIGYDRRSADHFIVGVYDFWPSTGLFIHRQTKERGRGIFNLIAKLSIV